MTAKGLDCLVRRRLAAAVDSTANTGFPSSPNFQAHHQPFNYFKSTAPGTPARLCATAAWATSPRPTNSWPTSRPASCHR